MYLWSSSGCYTSAATSGLRPRIRASDDDVSDFVPFLRSISEEVYVSTELRDSGVWERLFSWCSWSISGLASFSELPQQCDSS